MRKKLGEQEGERTKFRARFVRIGKKVNYKGYSEETVLLSEIMDATTNKIVSDHLWFSYTKAFQSIALHTGMLIEFEARVKSYTKGYANKRYGIDMRSQDFKLSHPTRIKVVAPQP